LTNFTHLQHWAIESEIKFDAQTNKLLRYCSYNTIQKYKKPSGIVVTTIRYYCDKIYIFYEKLNSSICV